MLKKCFKCGEEKDITLFYEHNEMTDGHLGKCKECTKVDATQYRNKNLESARAYDRKRSKLPHRKKLASEIRKKYRAKYPLRRLAVGIANRAIRSGRLQRKEICEMCGIKPTRILKHHTDYYKPLEVVWLCQPCHKALHKEIKKGSWSKE